MKINSTTKQNTSFKSISDRAVRKKLYPIMKDVETAIAKPNFSVKTLEETCQKYFPKLKISTKMTNTKEKQAQAMLVVEIKESPNNTKNLEHIYNGMTIEIKLPKTKGEIPNFLSQLGHEIIHVIHLHIDKDHIQAHLALLNKTNGSQLFEKAHDFFYKLSTEYVQGNNKSTKILLGKIFDEINMRYQNAKKEIKNYIIESAISEQQAYQFQSDIYNAKSHNKIKFKACKKIKQLINDIREDFVKK